MNWLFRRYIYIALSVFLAISLLTGCSYTDGPSDNDPANTGRNVVETNTESGEIRSASRDIFAMDTYMTITCYGDRCDEAADAAQAEIFRLDDLLSVGNPDSEISRINRDGRGEVSEDSQKMIDLALEIYDGTDGAFDITIYPLMVLWGFTSGDYNVPRSDELRKTLELVDSSQVRLDGDTVTIGDGQGIDLGGIAKGYASDRLMEIFEQYDLTAGLISLGGNVQLYRTKPDGSQWRCGIQDPYNADQGSSIIGVLEAADCAVITSGGYERYFTDDSGRTYHHILDPATGYSANNGLISVSIVSPSGVLADALSTACYVMGMEKSVEYWRSSEDTFDMILVTDEGELYITEGLDGYFTSDMHINLIKK